MKTTRMVFALLLLSGCATTNQIVSKNTAQLSGSRDEIARTFYSLAKDCWKRSGGALIAQIVVENVVTLDSVVVSARFDSFGSGVLNPFLKFVISGSDDTTNIELLTQEFTWIGRQQHMGDANNWMMGNFSCAQK